VRPNFSSRVHHIVLTRASTWASKKGRSVDMENVDENGAAVSVLLACESGMKGVCTDRARAKLRGPPQTDTALDAQWDSGH
jgi:hypothetical protein